MGKVWRKWQEYGNIKGEPKGGVYGENPGIWGENGMYYRDDQDQLSMEEYFLPFGGQLRKDNRWVQLTSMMPWQE